MSTTFGGIGAGGEVSIPNPLPVTGEVSLSAGTIADIQQAVDDANNAVETSLTNVADLLNDILAEIVEKIEAGEDVGLTPDAITALATAIATLFNYPTDYPDAGANSKLTTISGQLTTIAGYLDQLEGYVDGIEGYVDGIETLITALNALVTASNTKLDTVHTDLGHLTDNTQTTKITNGSQTADTLAGDSGQNSLLTSGSRKEMSFTTTSVAAVASADVSNFAWVSVHITSQGGSSTCTFQVSNDNSNWVSCPLANSASTAAASSAVSTVTGIYHGPITARYFRINVTGIVSGTTAGIVEFYSIPKALVTTGVMAAQSGTWTVQPGSTANTTPWLVQSSFTYAHIATSTTTTVKSGAGVLHGVSINSLGTVASSVTVYDNTAGSGTVIAVLDSLASARNTLFDVSFATGLTLVTTGTVAPDVTVSYR